MREIKFRAWDANKGEMSEEFELGGYPIFPNNRTRSYWSRMCQLLQYAGLKDKNEVLCYEGDIVKGVTGYIFEIVFFEGSFCIRSGDNHPMKNTNFIIDQSDCKTCEIIGNIYEHPHLLNSEQNPERSVVA